jgi:hypothetical protein
MQPLLNILLPSPLLFHTLLLLLLPLQDLQAFEDAKRKLAEDGRALPEGFVKVLQMPAARTGQQQRQAAAAEQ